MDNPETLAILDTQDRNELKQRGKTTLNNNQSDALTPKAQGLRGRDRMVELCACS